MSRRRFVQPGCVVSYRTRRLWRVRSQTVNVKDVEITDRSCVLVHWDGRRETVRDIWRLEWT